MQAFQKILGSLASFLFLFFLMLYMPIRENSRTSAKVRVTALLNTKSLLAIFSDSDAFECNVTRSFQVMESTSATAVTAVIKEHKENGNSERWRAAGGGFSCTRMI